MKRICEELQARLAGEGAQALRGDETAQAHLEECEDCYSVLGALARLDETLEAMPALDAPESAVRGLMARLAEEDAARTRQRDVRKRPTPMVRPLFVGLVAAAASVVLFAVVTPSLMRARVSSPRPPVDWERPETAADGPKLGELSQDKRDGVAQQQEQRRRGERPHEPPVRRPDAFSDLESRLRPPITSSDALARSELVEELELGDELAKDDLDRQLTDEEALAERYALQFGVVGGGVDAGVPAGVAGGEVGEREGKKVEAPSRGAYREEAGPSGLSPLERASLPTARAFLESRTATEELSYQPAKGYWANTYLPGDPSLRLLQARLDAWDRSPLQAQAGSPLQLHDASLRPSHSFDPPRNAALAVYLHADRSGLDGESRFLVQVGLRASSRLGGQRPAMNVGIVLDLRRDAPVEVAAAMRALVLAFGQARDVGDRFCLVVAGRDSAVVVEPADFKHGHLTVTLDALLTGGEPPAGETLGLDEALAAAMGKVRQGDDPGAPLGSSTVVLVTARPLGAAATGLANLAHRSAVAGIPVSVVGIGKDVTLAELDRLALAGQGNRRLLESRSEAGRLVEQELSSASSVVARAVRLRVRLAPGVRLVDVVGSRPLRARQAQRVREAERSIDRRLARNLGVEADRGDDEDGIQIVIPGFRAGDSHAILLDVVAAQAGPIADVTVRYKDVVFGRNGVTRTSLTLGEQLSAPGPLELGVLKHLLALRLSQTLALAGDALAAGRVAQVAPLLQNARMLRAGLGSLIPGLAGDPELARDEAMLAEYARLLTRSWAAARSQQAQLADSLRYAGRLKVLPRPVPLATTAR